MTSLPALSCTDLYYRLGYPPSIRTLPLTSLPDTRLIASLGLSVLPISPAFPTFIPQRVLDPGPLSVRRRHELP